MPTSGPLTSNLVIMSKFITSVSAINRPAKPFKADALDQIIMLRGIARFCGVELSLVEAKQLVDANDANIRTAHDFVAFIEAVINDRKAAA